jgi:hypothetical protein
MEKYANVIAGVMLIAALLYVLYNGHHKDK